LIPQETGHLGDVDTRGECVLLEGAWVAPEFLVYGGCGLEGDAAGEGGVRGEGGAEDVGRMRRGVGGIDA